MKTQFLHIPTGKLCAIVHRDVARSFCNFGTAAHPFAWAEASDLLLLPAHGAWHTDGSLLGEFTTEGEAREFCVLSGGRVGYAPILWVVDRTYQRGIRPTRMGG